MKYFECYECEDMFTESQIVTKIRKRDGRIIFICEKCYKSQADITGFKKPKDWRTKKPQTVMEWLI